MEAIEATAALTGGEVPAPRVLILTTFDLDELMFAALQAGASGFLLKDAPADMLTAGFRTVAGGDALLSPTVTQRLIAHYVSATATALHPPGVTVGRVQALTPRERQVLLLIAQGLSNNEIAVSFVLSEATVKTQIGRIFDKLAVRDRAQAVIAAYESGLVTPGAHS